MLVAVHPACFLEDWGFGDFQSLKLRSDEHPIQRIEASQLAQYQERSDRHDEANGHADGTRGNQDLRRTIGIAEELEDAPADPARRWFFRTNQLLNRQIARGGRLSNANLTAVRALFKLWEPSLHETSLSAAAMLRKICCTFRVPVERSTLALGETRNE
jgi:hypothetical protein